MMPLVQSNLAIFLYVYHAYSKSLFKIIGNGEIVDTNTSYLHRDPVSILYLPKS